MSVALSQKEIKLLKDFAKKLEIDNINKKIEDTKLKKELDELWREDDKNEDLPGSIYDMTQPEIMEYIKNSFTIEKFVERWLGHNNTAYNDILLALVKYVGDNDKSDIVRDLLNDYFTTNEVKEIVIEMINNL